MTKRVVLVVLVVLVWLAAPRSAHAAFAISPPGPVQMTTPVGTPSSMLVTIETDAFVGPGEELTAITKANTPDCSRFTLTTVETLPYQIKLNDPVHLTIQFDALARPTVTCAVTMRTTGGAANGTFVLNGTGLAPVSSTNMASLSFPDRRVSNAAAIPTAALTLRVSNVGDPGQNLQLGALSITGANAADFTVIGGPIPSSTIAPGGSADISVQFDPMMAGPRGATLNIPSNDPALPVRTIPLAGLGTNALIATTDVAFGMVAGGMTGTGNISVTNSASSFVGELRVASAAITQTSTWFSFDTNGAGCQGMTTCNFPGVVAPANIGVRCHPPVGVGGTQSATVTFVSDTDPGGDTTAMLSCSSGRPDIMVAPLTLTFAAQQVPTTSAPMAFMVSNIGSAPLTYSVASATGPFARVAGCTANCTLGAGMSTMVSVTFSPTATGLANGGVVITSNDPDAADQMKTVSLIGTGTAPQISVTSTLDFMTVELGANSTLPLAAMNTGTAPLMISSATITSGAASFSVTSGSSGSQTVGVGTSASWMIQCDPTAIGPLTGNFRVVSDSFTGGTANVTLTCTGQQGSLATTPVTTMGAPLDFGGVTVGATSTQMFTLRNPGNVAVTGITGTLAPTNAGYSIDPTTPIPTMLAAGGSTVIKVIFGPQAGTDGGSATIAFSGTWGASHPTTTTLFISGDGLTAGYDVTTIPSSSPPTIEFGSFRWDTTATGTFCIVNTEQTPLVIQTPITITPSSPTTTGELVVTAVKRNSTCSTTGGTTTTLPQTLNQGEVLVVTVTADPSDRTGAIAGTATVTSNLTMNPTRTINLTGVSTSGMLSVTPGPTVDFGGVDLDVGSAMRMITISNTGTGSLDLSSFATSGDVARFTLTLPGATTLLAGEQLMVPVTYVPTAASPVGSEDSITLSHAIDGQLGGPTSAMIVLKGRGIDRTIAIAQTPSFPDTFRNPGSAAPRVPVRVNNTGEATLRITAVMISGNAFSLVDSAPVQIAGGGSHDFVVVFAPRTAGAASGQLVLVNDDDGQPTATVMLRGNGIDRSVQLGPMMVDVGVVAIGRSVTIEAAVALTNLDATHVFRIRAFDVAEAGAFTIEEVSDGLELPASGMRTFSVTFAPESDGDFETTALLFLDEDTEPTATVLLRGRAVTVDVHGGGGCDAGRGGGGGLVLLFAALAVTRGRRRQVASLATLLVLAAPVRADDIRVGAFDPTPATAGEGFQLESADVGDHGDWVVSSVASHATNPMVIGASAQGMAVNDNSPISQRTMIALGGAIALFGRLEVGLHMPLYSQSGDAGAMSEFHVPPVSGTALGDLTFNAKLRFMDTTLLGAGLALHVTAPTASAGQFTGTDGPSLRVLGLARIAPSPRVALFANAGAVLRKTAAYREEVFIEQGSGFEWGGGVAVRAGNKLVVVAEVFGHLLPKSDEMTGSLSPIEGLLGVTYRLDRRLKIGAAVGRGISDGLGAPDLRGTITVSFAHDIRAREVPAPREVKPLGPDGIGVTSSIDTDGDHDGVVGAQDTCATTAEDKDGFEDSDGCPEPDNDKDGIADAQDACPNEPETMNGVQDSDGCADTSVVAPVEPTGDPLKAAEETFVRGRELMKQKQYANACAAFEQSQRLDPQAGTQYNLAGCYVELGKLASAWNLYRELVRTDRNDERRQRSTDLATQLARRVPKLRLLLKKLPVGTEVFVDGTNANALIGIDTPMDFGRYAITAGAPNHVPWRQTVEIKDDGKVVTVMIDLVPTARP